MSRSISQERAERLVNMLKLFVEHPGRRFNIRSFQEKFQLAKSTLSEDIDFLDRALKNDGTGRLKSQSGATGGVSFVPAISRQEKSSDHFPQKQCRSPRRSRKERVCYD